MYRKQLNDRLAWIKENVLKRFIGNRFSKPLQEIPSISSRLKGVASALHDLCRRTESDFLKLGHELEGICSDASELMKKSLDSVNLVGTESEQGVLSKVEKLAKGSLDELHNRREKVAANLDKVNSIGEDLGDLYMMCAVIDRIAMFLRIIGFNIDVESSRSIEATEMFGVVAQEMRMLSKRVSEIAERMRNDAKSAEISQITIHQEIFDSLKLLETLIGEAQKAVQDAVFEIQRFIQNSLAVLNQSSISSNIVSEQVGQIVIGIQLHDSMNQRIDHIRKAIDDMVTLFESLITNETDKPLTEICGKVYTVIGIQSEQLQLVISEIDSVYQNCQKAFEKIGYETESLAQSLAGFGGENIQHSELSEKSSHDPFKIFKAALMSLHDLLSQSRNLMNRIEETTEHATNTAEKLSALMDQIRSFGFETRLIALNAIIKASHIGDMGSTLDVLSQEMSRLSIKTAQFVTDVDKILESINAAAQELKSGQYISEKKQALPEGWARDLLDSGIQEISESYIHYQQEASDVFRSAEMMHGKIAQTRTDLNFLLSLGTELKGFLKEMENISHSVSNWASRNIGITEEEFTSLAERYTMQRERDVHQQVIERMKQNGNSEKPPILIPENTQAGTQSPPDVPLRGKEKRKGTKEEEFDDNIELF